MATMAENVIAEGAENRPLMLENSMYDSWKACIWIYTKGKENADMLINSIEEGLFQLKKEITVPDTETELTTVPTVVLEIAPEAKAVIVASHADVLDLVVHSGSETELTKAPPLPGYHARAGTEFKPFKGESERDPSGDESSESDPSEVAKPLHAQVVPSPPLQIVPAPRALPYRPAILVRSGQDIPFGRPYRLHPSPIDRWRATPLSTWYPLLLSELSSSSKISSPSSKPSSSSGTSHIPSGPLSRLRHQLSSYSTPLPSASIRPSHKRYRSPTSSLPAHVLAPTSLSSVPADHLLPRKRFRGSLAASLQEDPIEDTIEATGEVAAESIILHIHPEQTVGERLD
nr:hypothetical protein [Tanacetum cinerariifolium]